MYKKLLLSGSILTLDLIFVERNINTYNPTYEGNSAEISYETFFVKDRLVKEDYIKYFPYYKKWMENFDHIDISKIDLKNLPFPYCQLTIVLPFNSAGWYYNGEYIKKLFELNNFTTAVEIGSYLGVSTRHIASLLPAESHLYAIDTWNCFADHYVQFLSNIVISGLSHKVIPIQERSDKAIEYLIKNNKTFDFIYVDADHEIAGVLSDLENYFPILNPTGVICGDDWLWKSVRIAVEQFAQKYNLTVYADCNFWFLKKEDCGYCYKSFLSAEDNAWKFDNK